jgi:MFS family permease
MMLSAVVTSMLSGQVTSRIGKYKILIVVGSLLSAAGMAVFAVMDGNTPSWHVVLGMVIVGLGIGLVQPVYTLVVQNSAPREHMGAATASSQFFRSIGSTMGVAVFGTVLLSIYNKDFAAGVPPGTPDRALKPFSNPLLLGQIRPQLEAAFGKYPGGTELLHKLLADVRTALIHGLQVIFIMGAIVMAFGIVVNFLLPEVPLRGREAAPPIAD